MKNNNKRGFTLIELLIVIGIIGFIAAAILVAVDPVKRIQDSRNSQRWSEVNGILNAVLKNQVDDRALVSGGNEAGAGNIVIADATLSQIIIDNDSSATALASPACNSAPPTCTGASGGLNGTTTSSCYVDLDGLTPDYLAEIPTDPNGGVAATNTGYYFNRNTGGRITIGACTPEQSATINVKR